jgi:uncharacterized protein (TIGR02246 family)
MSNEKTEQELIGLETRYWQALKDGDMHGALRLTDDPCIVTGPQGLASITRKQFAEMMQKPSWSLEDFELEQMHVRMLGDDVAIVAYKVREKMIVEGKPVTLDAADTSTWVRRGDGWLCALHTEALSGDPFGRDRKAA